MKIFIKGVFLGTIIGLVIFTYGITTIMKTKMVTAIFCGDVAKLWKE
jgi:hypothetical protein